MRRVFVRKAHRRPQIMELKQLIYKVQESQYVMWKMTSQKMPEVEPIEDY